MASFTTSHPAVMARQVSKFFSSNLHLCDALVGYFSVLQFALVAVEYLVNRFHRGPTDGFTGAVETVQTRLDAFHDFICRLVYLVGHCLWSIMMSVGRKMMFVDCIIHFWSVIV